jgi:uncharacterized membrane protein YgdD (TMEM256/DUF423 family)
MKYLLMRKWAYGLVILAGLFGTAGVLAAAGAAHTSSNPLLQTVSTLLLLHSGALIGIAALALLELDEALPFLAAGSLLGVGALLFSTDLAVRALYETRLFPYAAPASGILLIFGWLAVALAAVIAFVRRE